MPGANANANTNACSCQYANADANASKVPPREFLPGPGPAGPVEGGQQDRRKLPNHPLRLNCRPVGLKLTFLRNQERNTHVIAK